MTSHPFALDGRTALVTGAGRGIGAAIALALDRGGARVALLARSEGELAAVAATLAHDPVVVPADLGTPDGPGEGARQAVAALGGRLDVLVNNAGVLHRQDVEAITVEDMDRVWAVNVRAVLLLCGAVLPAMADAGDGSVINVSSVSGLRGAPRRALYGATKAALDGMTRALAMEYGPRGVRVNSVAPGVVETEMWRENLAKPGVAAEVLGHIALRRLSTPEDVADAVVFLASPAARYLTGEVLAVDGGMRSTLNLYPSV